MDIKTKHDVDKPVFVMYDNKATQTPVKGVMCVIEHKPSTKPELVIEYKLSLGGREQWIKEGLVHDTKEELLKTL